MNGPLPSRPSGQPSGFEKHTSRPHWIRNRAPTHPTMKAPFLATSTLNACLMTAAIGCSTQKHTLTSPSQPGPAVGQTLGTGVGLVGGNLVGAGVGFGEGVVRGAVAPFDNTHTTRVVRRWHTETTSDGRTIQVPEDILVDAYGRPVGSTSKK